MITGVVFNLFSIFVISNCSNINDVIIDATKTINESKTSFFNGLFSFDTNLISRNLIIKYIILIKPLDNNLFIL